MIARLVRVEQFKDFADQQAPAWQRLDEWVGEPGVRRAQPRDEPLGARRRHPDRLAQVVKPASVFDANVRPSDSSGEAMC